MRILEEVITRDDLWKAENVLGEEMVKAVVDVERGLLVIDAEMHADEDGIVEFDSMINVRPRQNNRSRDVEDPEIRKKIREIVDRWVK